MSRTPLASGACIEMVNGGKYRIRKLLAEGGFSILYDAETLGGTSHIVIKEFFPAEGAYRNSAGKVCPAVGCEESFKRNLECFENEGVVGGSVAESTFQTIPFISCGNGYALMQKESTDMRSIADLVKSWNVREPIPFTGKMCDSDPVFRDYSRVAYSLRVIESLLTVLKIVHQCGFLHLDISSSNVLWAGQDQETGRNCVAILADFGCAVQMRRGCFRPDAQLSYSPGFVAPETMEMGNELNVATDIYSVGILLFYLCVGDAATDISHFRKRHIERELSCLRIPRRICEKLLQIMLKATANQKERYQSADEMKKDVCELLELIPTHPINPDNTKAFSLYSLKSMLEGSRDSHHGWIHELCDRRNRELPNVDSLILEPMSEKKFADDYDFLKSILPEELFAYLRNKIATIPDKQQAVKSIMSGNYQEEWKNDIINLLNRYDTIHRLLSICRSLLDDERVYFNNQNKLSELSDEAESRLLDCFYYCGNSIRNDSYIGLAILVVFALIGPDGFAKFVPSPSVAGKRFRAL